MPCDDDVDDHDHVGDDHDDVDDHDEYSQCTSSNLKDHH